MSVLEKLASAAELSAFTVNFPFLEKTYGLFTPGVGDLSSLKFPLPFYFMKKAEERAIDRSMNLYSSVSSILLNPFPDVPKDIPIDPLPSFFPDSPGFSVFALPKSIPLQDFGTLPYSGDPDEPRYAAAMIEVTLTINDPEELAVIFFQDREERDWKWTDYKDKNHHLPYERIETEMRKFVVNTLVKDLFSDQTLLKELPGETFSGERPSIEFKNKDGETIQKTTLVSTSFRSSVKTWLRIVVPIWHLAEFIENRTPVVANYDLFGPREDLTKLPPTPEAKRVIFSRRKPLRPLDFYVRDLPRGPATERLSNETEQLFANAIAEEPWKYAALRGSSNLADTDVLLAHLDPWKKSPISFQRKYEPEVGEISVGPEWMVTKTKIRRLLLETWKELPTKEKKERIEEAKKNAENAGEITTLDWIFGPSLEALIPVPPLAQGELWDFDPGVPQVAWLQKDIQSLDRFATYVEATRSAHVLRLERKKGGPFTGPPQPKEVEIEKKIWREIFGNEWMMRFMKFSKALGGGEGPLWSRERMEAFRTGERPTSKTEDPEIRKIILESLDDEENIKIISENAGFLPFFVEVVPEQKNSLLRLEESIGSRPSSRVRKRLSQAFEEFYLKGWWNRAALERSQIMEGPVIFSPSVTKEVEHLVGLGLRPSKKSLEIWAETKLLRIMVSKRAGEVVRFMEEYIETMDAAFRERRKAIQSVTNIILGKNVMRKGLHFVSSKDKSDLTHKDARIATLFILRRKPSEFMRRVKTILSGVKPDIEKGIEFLLNVRVKDAATEFFSERYYLREKALNPRGTPTLFDLWNFVRSTTWAPFVKISIENEKNALGLKILPEGVLDEIWIGWFARNRNNGKAHVIVGAVARWDRKGLSRLRRLPFARERVAELLKDQKKTAFVYYALLRVDFDIAQARRNVVDEGDLKGEITLLIPNLDFPADGRASETKVAAAMQNFVKSGLMKAAHETTCFDDFLCERK